MNVDHSTMCPTLRTRADVSRAHRKRTKQELACGRNLCQGSRANGAIPQSEEGRYGGHQRDIVRHNLYIDRLFGLVR
jgi:hypothetical protein